MINIVLFGPPGSGKGTQSEKLIKKYGLSHLSTGDILRNEIAEGTELGRRAKSYMDAGDLVPDHEVIAMLTRRLAGSKDSPGFIFDGFPRTVEQAGALDQELEKLGLRVDIMVSLEVEKEELIKRLLLRAKDTGRADDTLEVIEKRLEVYTSQTMPLIDFYKKMNKYASVDGMGSVDDIFGRIVRVVDDCK